MFNATFATTPPLLPPCCPLDTLEIGEGVKCGIKNSWRYFLSLPLSSSTFCRPERGWQFPLTHSPPHLFSHHLPTSAPLRSTINIYVLLCLLFMWLPLRVWSIIVSGLSLSKVSKFCSVDYWKILKLWNSTVSFSFLPFPASQWPWRSHLT